MSKSLLSGLSSGSAVEVFGFRSDGVGRLRSPSPGRAGRGAVGMTGGDWEWTVSIGARLLSVVSDDKHRRKDFANSTEIGCIEEGVNSTEVEGSLSLIMIGTRGGIQILG